MVKETYSSPNNRPSMQRHVAETALQEAAMPRETIPADTTINELRSQLQLVSIPELSETLTNEHRSELIAETQKNALVVAAEVLPHHEAVRLGIRADIVDNTSFLQPPTLESACLIAEAYDIGDQNPTLVAPLRAVCSHLQRAEDGAFLTEALNNSLTENTSFAEALHILQVKRDEEFDASLPKTMPELFAKNKEGVVTVVEDSSRLVPHDAVVFPVEKPSDDWDY